MLLWLKFTFLAAAWGGSYLFMRQVAPYLGPTSLAGFRIGVAALMLSPFAWKARKKLLPQWRLVFLAGLFNMALPMSLLSWVMKFLAAAHGSIINASAPLFAGAVGYLAFKEKPAPGGWVGLALGLVGIMITMEPWKGSAKADVIPVLVALMAMVSYGFGIHLAHRVKSIQPVSNAAGTMVAAFLWLALPMILEWPNRPIPAKAYASGLALGVISTGIAFVLYYQLLERWGTLRTSMVTYAAPFFAMLWGWWVLGERVEGAWVPGLALVLLGLSLGRGGKKGKA